MFDFWLMFEIALLMGGLIVLFVVGWVLSNRRLKWIIAYHRARAVSEPVDEIVQRVKGMVAENRGMDPNDIFLDMNLEGDLGITGDDATELFENFAKNFPDVDLSELDLSRYFGPEGGFAGWSFSIRRGPLRVSDVVQAA